MSGRVIRNEFQRVLGTTPALTALLTGGLWDRPLQRPVPGQPARAWHTPGAFDPDGTIRLCAVIAEPGLVPHPTAIFMGMADAFVSVFLYAPLWRLADMTAAKEIIRSALVGHRWIDGDRHYRSEWFGDWADGPTPSEEFGPESRVDWIRFRVTTQVMEA